MKRNNTKVLVVDDDKGIGQMLTMVLERNGYEVLVSKNPEDTEENIISHNIEVVLLDILIGGVNGIDVCTRLRRDEAIGHVKILMMSALHGAEEKCKAAGANGFIAKPFQIRDLLEIMQMSY